VYVRSFNLCRGVGFNRHSGEQSEASAGGGWQISRLTRDEPFPSRKGGDVVSVWGGTVNQVHKTDRKSRVREATAWFWGCSLIKTSTIREIGNSSKTVTAIALTLTGKPKPRGTWSPFTTKLIREGGRAMTFYPNRLLTRGWEGLNRLDSSYTKQS